MENQSAAVNTSPNPVTPEHKFNIPLVTAIILCTSLIIGIGYFLNKRSTLKQDKTAQITSITPTNSQTNLADWQEYKNDIYSFKYPPHWYINNYSGSSNFVYSVEVSDIKNSITEIQGMSDVHTRIDIRTNANPMPTSFPYSNGSAANDTIKPFTINSLRGIRGMQTSPAGITDTVYLMNSIGGYAELLLVQPTQNVEEAERIFNSILSTFQFNEIITPTMQTFKNSEVTFQYPSNWRIQENCQFGQQCVVSPDFKVDATGNSNGIYKVAQGEVFSITSMPLVPEMKLEDAACRPGGPLYVGSCIPTNIGGIAAMQRSEGSPQDSEAVIVLKNKFYNISIHYHPSNTEAVTIFNNVLSSFKFNTE